MVERGGQGRLVLRSAGLDRAHWFEAKIAAENFPITVLYRAPKLAWLQPLIENGRGQDNVHLARADVSGVRELVGRDLIVGVGAHLPGGNGAEVDEAG